MARADRDEHAGRAGPGFRGTGRQHLRQGEAWPVTVPRDGSAVATAREATRAGGTEPVISIQTTVVDGVELTYLAAGSGPPLILLHGYTETSHMWEAVIPH